MFFPSGFAQLYNSGTGLTINREKALALFCAAAQNGSDATAAFCAGDCYEKGIGTAVDLKKAHEFYALAQRRPGSRCGRREARFFDVEKEEELR
jgi:TPR repeat protein